jgi:nitrogen fixation NifU-like protein
MSDGLILYQKDILRHARSPKGYGKISDAHITVQGDSPICGDHLTLYIRMAGDKLESVTFDSEACCAVCRASSSMLTAVVSQKPVAEASEIKDAFLSMLGSGDEDNLATYLPEIRVFSKIAQVPSRVECAALAWITLGKCLAQITEPVDRVQNDPATRDTPENQPALAR